MKQIVLLSIRIINNMKKKRYWYKINYNTKFRHKCRSLDSESYLIKVKNIENCYKTEAYGI